MKHLNVSLSQRGDNAGLSGGWCGISKGFELFAKAEQVVAEPSVIQQQEQVLRDSQILQTILAECVAVVLQVGAKQAKVKISFCMFHSVHILTRKGWRT